MHHRNTIAVYQERIGCTIESIADKIQSAISLVVREAKIVFRVKDPEDLKRKMLYKKITDVFLIRDVYGLRILVRSVDEAYLILKKIRELPYGARLVDDFIASPKQLTGPSFEGKEFKCLRIIAQENNVPFEVQITTYAFHEINESHHNTYKQERYK
jgi:(p)ppGpp synthase/HD superfamily hydrolase